LVAAQVSAARRGGGAGIWGADEEWVQRGLNRCGGKSGLGTRKRAVHGLGSGWIQDR
jgi:hypothetical protein